MIQKQGNWVLYELTPRNVERWFSTCEMLLARHKRKVFLHHIVTGDEICILYDNPKRKKSWYSPGLASTSTAEPNIHGKKLLCIWWDQLSAVYCELFKPNETISRAFYRTQFMRLSRALKEKRNHYYSRHDKVILLHDNFENRKKHWISHFFSIFQSREILFWTWKDGEKSYTISTILRFTCMLVWWKFIKYYFMTLY